MMARTGSGEADQVATALAEMSDLPYFRVDADRNVVEVSPAMERLTGFEADEVLGRSCLRLHRCQECLAGCGVFENGQVTDKCIELYRADGSIVQVSKSGRVFLDAEGEISGAIEVLHPLSAVEGTGVAAHDAPEADHERERIRAALERTRYHRQDAARLLDVSRTTLWRKMREYGL